MLAKSRSTAILLFSEGFALFEFCDFKLKLFLSVFQTFFIISMLPLQGIKLVVKLKL